VHAASWVVAVTVIVDTSEVQARLRTDLLRNALSWAAAEQEVLFLGPDDRAHARLEHWQLSDDVALMSQASSGIRHSRTGRHLRHDTPERVAFVVHRGGPGSFTHAGRSHALRRDGLYLADASATFRFLRPGDGIAQIVLVDRGAIHATAEQVQRASRHLESSGLATLFRHHLVGLAADADALASSTQSPAVAASTTQLAECLVSDAAGASTPSSRDVLHAALHERIRLFLQVNYARPDLSAELVAHAHGISTRYLFKIWADDAETFAETLMSLRLEAARRMVESRPDLAVGVVAHRCGFLTASHFSRRYRSAFGETAAETRRQRGP
jgi:AraC-like DNA-binding protein